MKHNIENLINKQTPGINISLLESGTKLTIETKNSVYKIEIIDKAEITIMGGMDKNGDIRFPQPEEVFFNGSTFGGSMIKPNWIGQGMNMEIQFEHMVFVSSPVKEIEIEAPDGSWQYAMNWKKEFPA